MTADWWSNHSDGRDIRQVRYSPVSLEFSDASYSNWIDSLHLGVWPTTWTSTSWTTTATNLTMKTTRPNRILTQSDEMNFTDLKQIWGTNTWNASNSNKWFRNAFPRNGIVQQQKSLQIETETITMTLRRLQSVKCEDAWNGNLENRRDCNVNVSSSASMKYRIDKVIKIINPHCGSDTSSSNNNGDISMVCRTMHSDILH